MATDHYIERCKHGVVVSQCRCPGPRTEYVTDCPDTCEVVNLKDALATRDAELAELRAELAETREDLVWSLANRAHLWVDDGPFGDGHRAVAWTDTAGYCDDVKHDGTTASILAAVRAARRESR